MATFKHSYVGFEIIGGPRSTLDRTFVYNCHLFGLQEKKMTCVLFDLYGLRAVRNLLLKNIGFFPTFSKWALIRGSWNSKTRRQNGHLGHQNMGDGHLLEYGRLIEYLQYLGQRSLHILYSG